MAATRRLRRPRAFAAVRPGASTGRHRRSSRDDGCYDCASNMARIIGEINSSPVSTPPVATASPRGRWLCLPARWWDAILSVRRAPPPGMVAGPAGAAGPEGGVRRRKTSMGLLSLLYTILSTLVWVFPWVLMAGWIVGMADPGGRWAITRILNTIGAPFLRLVSGMLPRI